MSRLETVNFQLHSHQPFEAAVIKQQIKIKIFAINNHALLALHEGKALAQFQDKLLQLANQCLLQIVLQVALRQAEKIEKIRVFEGARKRMGNVGGGVCSCGQGQLAVRNVRALKGFALDLPDQFTLAPHMVNGLAGIKPAGCIVWQHEQNREMRPTQL